MPDSPYAAELLRGPANFAFAPEVEREYLRAHLAKNHVLIRVTCVLGALLSIGRGVEQITTGFALGNALLGLALAFVVAASLLLTVIAWSTAFEQLFIPLARVLVPARNVVVAACMVGAAARGQTEMLMLLPILLLGPFFFLGLSFRAGLFSGVITAASFVAHASYFELPVPVTLRAYAFLVVGLIACAIAARHLERLSRTSFLEARLISQLAQHDPLTGSKNRRVFDEHLSRLWPQAHADGRTIALLLVDVDHFKAYNDRYGHQAGDQVLRQIAQSMQRHVNRPLDLLARYGGEEFVAVLYDVGGKQAMDIARRMRRCVEALAIEHKGSSTSPAVTISIGVAVVEPTPERTARGALQLADQALYAAKVGGRNRIELMNAADYGMMVTGVFSKQARAAHG
ncbi:MAG: diguanylate cyclase [Pseudomonadota bacterium]|nr:diguanylate cyclase [Pseudomonadota bacterium]